jgi:translation initiation factor IF-3
VCKLGKFTEVLNQLKEKKKDSAIATRARTIKEMYLTAGIELRDFLTKMKKVNEMLCNGHPVKISIIAKKFTKNQRFKDGVRRDRMAGNAVKLCGWQFCSTYFYLLIS